jgi:hypothetical protein
MRQLGLLLLCSALAAPAAAQVTLLDDGRWRVTGVADAAAPQIAVSVDEVSAGSFAELRFAFSDGGGFDEVLVLRGDGALTPALPGGPPGASASFGSYWDCEAGLVGPLRFVSLELPARSKKSGVLDLRGELSNLDSLVSEKLKLRIRKPKPDKTRLELRYRLRTTRELCIDKARQDTAEEFHIVEFDANFLGPNVHSNDLTRYVKDLRFECDGLDCDVDRVSFCAPLVNQTGYVLDNPQRFEDERMWLFHTSDAPAATPTLLLELRKPSFRHAKPQGHVTESFDPTARNVQFWADWVKVNGQYGAGKKLSNFRFALEAEPPRDPSCDRTQD